MKEVALAGQQIWHANRGQIPATAEDDSGCICLRPLVRYVMCLYAKCRTDFVSRAFMTGFVQRHLSNGMQQAFVFLGNLKASDYLLQAGSIS